MEDKKESGNGRDIIMEDKKVCGNGFETCKNICADIFLAGRMCVFMIAVVCFLAVLVPMIQVRANDRGPVKELSREASVYESGENTKAGKADMPTAEDSMIPCGITTSDSGSASVIPWGITTSDSGSTGMSKETWDAFTPEFVNPPESAKAYKDIALETNAPAGVKVSYAVSDTKYAVVDENGVLTGKQVGKVLVMGIFTAVVDGVEQAKTAECTIKIAGRKKVYIDPGHQSRANGGQEPVGPGSSVTKAKVAGGCTGTVTKIPEYKFALTIGKKLKKALLAEGYDVAMSRTKNNVDISNVERAKKGNKSGADICIRIHSDSIGDSSVRGVSVLYPSTANPYPVKKQAKKSKKLAKALIKEYCKATGIKSRGIVVRNDLSGTNWSTIPTVLIECGFFSNPSEDRLLNDPDMQEKMVDGMVAGINKYFGY